MNQNQMGHVESQKLSLLRLDVSIAGFRRSLTAIEIEC